MKFVWRCDRIVLCAATGLVLAGCGLAPPKISEFWDQDFTYAGDALTGGKPVKITASGQLEYEIRKRVFCDLKLAVIDAQKIKFTDNGVHPTKLIPEDWIVHVSLSLQVDESTSLSPGLALKTPMHAAITHFANEVSGSAASAGAGYPFLSTPQSYSLGLGGTASSTATRIDKFDPYYTIANLQTSLESPHACETYDKNPDTQDYFFRVAGPQFKPASSSFLISSQLKIREWLIDSMFLSRKFPSHVETPAPNKSAPLPPLEVRRAKLTREGYKDAEITQIIAMQAISKSTGTKDSGGGVAGVGGSARPDTISLEIKFIVLTSGNVTPSWNLVRISANTSNTAFFAGGRTRTHDLIITIGPPTNDTASSHLASLIGQSVASHVQGLNTQ